MRPKPATHLCARSLPEHLEPEGEGRRRRDQIERDEDERDHSRASGNPAPFDAASYRQRDPRFRGGDDGGDMRLIPKLPKPKTKAGRTGMIVGGVVGGLIALDLLALAATAVIAATAGLR
jgi:hypothetical protein